MDNIKETDELYIGEAISEALIAEAMDEVPVGAVVVRGGEIIARAHNLRQTNKCATHHAELLAIEKACSKLGGWRLVDTTLYVTMEPCPMCAGAIINARIPRVVFGAHDLRFGAFGSLFDMSKLPLNHKPQIVGGVRGEECRNLLSDYFKEKRIAEKEAKENARKAAAEEDR